MMASLRRHFIIISSPKQICLYKLWGTSDPVCSKHDLCQLWPSLWHRRLQLAWQGHHGSTALDAEWRERQVRRMCYEEWVEGPGRWTTDHFNNLRYPHLWLSLTFMLFRSAVSWMGKRQCKTVSCTRKYLTRRSDRCLYQTILPYYK